MRARWPLSEPGFNLLKEYPIKCSSVSPRFANPAELADHQLSGLQWTVRHAWDNSPFYHDRLADAGINPDDIKSLADLPRLPFTTAQDLAAGYPFALRAAPFADIVRIHASSGTTGKRKVLCYTQNDLDDWQAMFARCYELAGLTREDRVQIAVGYGLWTAGIGFQLACEKFGAMAIPVGPATWRSRSASSRTSNPPSSVVPPPWDCSWRRKYTGLV